MGSDASSSSEHSILYRSTDGSEPIDEREVCDRYRQFGYAPMPLNIDEDPSHASRAADAARCGLEVIAAQLYINSSHQPILIRIISGTLKRCNRGASICEVLVIFGEGDTARAEIESGDQPDGRELAELTRGRRRVRIRAKETRMRRKLITF